MAKYTDRTHQNIFKVIVKLGVLPCAFENKMLCNQSN